MKAMAVHVPRIASACAAGSMHRPEIINHLLISDARRGTRAAIGLAILFCGAQKLTTRRAWQTEAHPRYGVTRGEELGLEADRAGSGARAGTQLIKARPPGKQV